MFMGKMVIPERNFVAVCLCEQAKYDCNSVKDETE